MSAHGTIARQGGKALPKVQDIISAIARYRGMSSPAARYLGVTEGWLFERYEHSAHIREKCIYGLIRGGHNITVVEQQPSVAMLRELIPAPLVVHLGGGYSLERTHRNKYDMSARPKGTWYLRHGSKRLAKFTSKYAALKHARKHGIVRSKRGNNG